MFYQNEECAKNHDLSHNKTKWIIVILGLKLH